MIDTGRSHRFVRLIGLVIALMGGLVMLGWYLQLTPIVQVLPEAAPMRHNTALCFVLSGLALISLVGHRGRWVLGLGGIVTLIAWLTLIQYGLDINLGIDELLVNDYLVDVVYPADPSPDADVMFAALPWIVKMTHPMPGRPSPTTALGFLLLGTNLLLLSWRRSPRLRSSLPGSLLSTTAFALSTVALVGYLSGLVTTYRWGYLTGVALHTACGLMLLSGCLVWLSVRGEQTELPRWLPGVVGFGVLVATIFLCQALLAWEWLQRAELNPMLTVVDILRTPDLSVIALGGIMTSVLLTLMVYLAARTQRYAHRVDRINQLLAQEIVERRRLETELRHAQHELEVRMEELQQLDQIKDAMLNTISHELRAPMANIKMATQMLEVALTAAYQQPDESGAVAGSLERGQTYLQILQHECDREIALINDLLDMQRIEAGAVTIVLDVIDVDSWLRQVVAPFQGRAQERELSLEIEWHDVAMSVVSDAELLGRIVAELLHNACKYTPPGERIIVIVGSSTDWLQLQIQNFGVEIPDDQLPQIFERFYRIAQIDVWQQGGTGLGLSIVQRLVEILQGQIQAESYTNQTCFTVRVPNHQTYSARLPV